MFPTSLFFPLFTVTAASGCGLNCFLIASDNICFAAYGYDILIKGSTNHVIPWRTTGNLVWLHAVKQTETQHLKQQIIVVSMVNQCILMESTWLVHSLAEVRVQLWLTLTNKFVTLTNSKLLSSERSYHSLLALLHIEILFNLLCPSINHSTRSNSLPTFLTDNVAAHKEDNGHA